MRALWRKPDSHPASRPEMDAGPDSLPRDVDGIRAGRAAAIICTEFGHDLSR